MEIYEDRVRDLLHDPSQGQPPQGINSNDLVVREDEDGKTIIDGVEFFSVTGEEEIYARKEEGERRRHFGETAMNTRSSRSHTIFTLVMESQDIGNEENGAVKRSIMNLVDLAGSERPGNRTRPFTRRKSLLVLSSPKKKNATPYQEMYFF